MSRIRVVHLACDGIDGTTRPCDELYRGQDNSVAGTRREARRAGWRTAAPGGTDFCPQHRGQARHLAHRRRRVVDVYSPLLTDTSKEPATHGR